MYSLCVLCTNISTQYRTVQFSYMWFKGRAYFFPHSKCLSSFLFQFLASGTGFQDLGRIIFCIFFFLLKPVYIYPKNYSTVVFFFPSHFLNLFPSRNKGLYLTFVFFGNSVGSCYFVKPQYKMLLFMCINFCFHESCAMCQLSNHKSRKIEQFLKSL